VTVTHYAWDCQHQQLENLKVEAKKHRTAVQRYRDMFYSQWEETGKAAWSVPNPSYLASMKKGPGE
jgi:hypothetical protein